jgi:hypothetical protein
MIALNSTWNTVVMLLVAGGVGLIGGIGAGLLEMRRDSASTSGTPGASGSQSRSKWGGFWASIVLGGIAAIAILYFFPPAQEIVKTGPGEEQVTTTSYDLTKLVALALIVGSAGSAFLQVMQTRALALANAERAKATEETGIAALDGVGQHAAELTKTGVTAAAPQIRAELQRAGVEEKRIDVLVDQVAERASDSVKDSIEPYVKSAQKMVSAAGVKPLAEVVPTAAVAPTAKAPEVVPG